MMTNGKIATALVGGYLLGRTRKAKLAVGMGMFLAGKKLPANPAELGRLVAGSPVLSGLSDQMRRELVDATKSAATSALTNRANTLADSLQERTAGLQEPGGEEKQEDRDDGEKRVERPAQDGEQSERRSRQPRRTAASSRTRKTAGTGGARKAASGTRKAAGGTAEAVSGAAGKTARTGKSKAAAGSRGGRHE